MSRYEQSAQAVGAVLDAIFAEHAPLLVGRVPVRFVRVPPPNWLLSRYTVPHSTQRTNLHFELQIDPVAWVRLTTDEQENTLRHEAAHFLAYVEFLTGPSRGRGTLPGHGPIWRKWAEIVGVDTSVGVPPHEEVG